MVKTNMEPIVTENKDLQPAVLEAVAELLAEHVPTDLDKTIASITHDKEALAVIQKLTFEQLSMDSLAVLELIMQFEEKLGIDLTDENIDNELHMANSLRQFIDCIDKQYCLEHGNA